MKVSARRLWQGVLSVALVAALPQAAHAQTMPEAARGQAFPGRAQEQFRAKDKMPKTIPQIEVREIKLEGAPAGAEKVTFTLDSLSLEGVTAYRQEDLAALYANRMSQTISLADLYTIAADLTRKYRNDGYILTQVIVPPQTIDKGHASLKVVEGFISKVDVQASDSDTEETARLIRAYADHIHSTGALNVKELERALLLINDLPGVQARGVLSPSPAQTGAADMLIIITRRPYDALISVDNFGTAYLGPVQLSAAGAANSLLGWNERLTVQAVYAPNHQLDAELAYLSLGYMQPVWDDGTTFEILNGHTFTKPGYNLEQFGVDGESHTMTFKFEHPFIRSRSVNLSGRALFDYRNTITTDNLVGDPRREDRIRALRIGARYEFLDTLVGLGYNIFDLEASQGLHIFGASPHGLTTLSRPAATIDFFKINAEIQRLQRLSENINFLMSVKGQYSDNALLSGEEFGIGGINYGRGYDASEIIGDQGIAGKLELQWNDPIQIDLFKSYQAFAFLDGGRIWNEDATTSAQKRDTLSSTGLGIRADFNDVTSGSLIFAQPLNRRVQTKGTDTPTLYFSLSRKF